MKTFLISLVLVSYQVTALARGAPTVYIPLGSANVVIAVDSSTDKITATYTGVENSHGLVATPDGEYLIAGSLSQTPVPPGKPDAPNSKLFFIHPAHGHVMSTIPVSGWTHHEAITPDGRYVLSTHGGQGSISVVDLEQSKVVRTVKTGPSPNYTLITRDSKRAYVSNTGNGSISEIDLSSWNVTRSLESGPSPEHMVFSNDEKTIYVGNPQAGTVSAVSIASGKVTKTYPVGKSAHGLDISDDGKTLFASSKKEDKLVALDPVTGKQRVLKLSPAPYHLNTIHGAGKVYVSSSKEPVIWVVDQKTLKLIHTIKLPGGEGHQMAVVKD